ANDCTQSVDSVLVEGVVMATAIVSDAVCNGEATGSISLTVNGGTAPYTYNWTNGLPGSSNQTNVSANSYDVTVTDFNGCTASTTVVVGEPSAISITSQVVTDALCAGEASGAIDINVSGGTAPYSYAWSNLDTDEDITNITSGNYVVTITDAANCEFISGNIVVGESSDIVISNVNIQDASCFGTATGAISIDVTGGAGNYLYSWENNVPTPISNSEDLTGLRGGTYSLTVTDGNGCIEILSGLFVNEPADISISTNVSNTSIANNDGAINTDITGGTSPYDYNWFSTTGGGFSSDEEDIVGLMPGYYALTVTDANDCTQSVDSVLVEGVVMATAIVSDVNCNGGDDGMIDVTPTGGIAPFSYLWNDNATLEDRDGLSAGTWSVTITDAVGTTFMQSYTIDEPVAMAFQSVNVIGETGTGCNGSINISVTGGSLPYSYQWSNGASSEDVTDLCKGNYSVTVIDAKGCIVIRNQINVAAGALSIANLDVEDAKCFGGSDGSATISILGGCEPYTFTLDNGSTTTITTNTATFDGLSAGTYNVEIVDVNSTSISVPFTIGEGSPVIVTVENVINNSDDTGADCNGAIQISATGGSGNYSYSWNNGMTSEDIEGLCETLSPYSVTVTDENGCTGTLEGITMRRIITEVQDTRCFDECNGEIRLDIVGGNPPYSYVWSDGETGSIRTSLCAGPYEVTVTDNLGDIVHIATNFVDGPSDPINITVDALGQPLGNTSTGSIGISVDGGWGNYTIQWQGPNGFISTVEDIVALEEGAYVVTVIDENGCSETE
ncbi:MAG: SprB repeat-containing protein, partial [Bacteroidota bacterium]